MVTKFEQTIRELEGRFGFQGAPDNVFLSIPDSKTILLKGLQFFEKDKAQWLPEYDHIADWLEGNEGKGLLCVGNCGRGKTLICGKILPILIKCYHKKIITTYSAISLNDNIDKAKELHLLYVDDVGTESIAVRYGEKRMAFPELVDEAEKAGKLLIASTNLSIPELEEKYGIRTVDRLRGIAKVVVFQGESLRGK